MSINIHASRSANINEAWECADSTMSRWNNDKLGEIFLMRK